MILKTVRDRNPFEAYRLLVQRFDSQSADREAVDIQELLDVQRATNVKDAQMKLAAWEDRIRQFMRKNNAEPLNEGVKKVKMMALMPVAVTAYLNDQTLLNPQPRQALFPGHFASLPWPGRAQPQ